MTACNPSAGDAESARAEYPGELKYIQYQHSLEAQYLPAIRALISKDLSEPYSIYVYRYFLCQWGHLCFMVGHERSGLYGLAALLISL
jgi:peptide alpha-N-acetyltransferase